MADFIETMEAIWDVEHNSDDELVLHFNSKEKSYTFYGIYPYTKLPSYRKIDKALAKTNYRLKVASSLLAKDEQLYQEVLGYYYENYWKPLKMDFIDNTHTAKEIMVFIINVGLGRKRKMFKAIQKMLNKHNNCNLVVDGIIGKKTIDCLNKFDETTFSKLFDEFEIDFYDKLVKHYARLTWALKGWHKRARYV